MYYLNMTFPNGKRLTINSAKRANTLIKLREVYKRWFKARGVIFTNIWVECAPVANYKENDNDHA